jgi:hypothetical protein
MKIYENYNIEDLENEQWIKILNFPNYLVSNLGRVKSIKYHNHILRQYVNSKGYLKVRPYLECKKRSYFVHRLVGENFLVKDRPFINHKNGVKTDNRADNLEWVDHSENLLHAFRILKVKRPSRKGISYGRGKPVLQLDIDGRLISEFSSAYAAEQMLKFHGGQITDCCNGKRETYKGYKWEFKNKNHVNI